MAGTVDSRRWECWARFRARGLVRARPGLTESKRRLCGQDQASGIGIRSADAQALQTPVPARGPHAGHEAHELLREALRKEASQITQGHPAHRSALSQASPTSESAEDRPAQQGAQRALPGVGFALNRSRAAVELASACRAPTRTSSVPTGVGSPLVRATLRRLSAGPCHALAGKPPVAPSSPCHISSPHPLPPGRRRLVLAGCGRGCRVPRSWPRLSCLRTTGFAISGR
jgi:hypothetical protein